MHHCLYLLLVLLPPLQIDLSQPYIIQHLVFIDISRYQDPIRAKQSGLTAWSHQLCKLSQVKVCFCHISVEVSACT